MVNVGVIGLGMMGLTHLDVYGRRDDARVVAVCDRDPERLAGRQRAAGNIEGQAAGGAAADDAKRYTDAAELIGDPDVQLVDICLPTPLHLSVGRQAIASGKHVLIEKPLARTAADAEALAAAAEASDAVVMPAMCMRFWPGWVWLKEAIDDRRHGALLGLHLCRLSAHPGGGFYSDGAASGGALLDLHIHDSDFVAHCLGMPGRVFTRGYSKVTDEPDHVMTQYVYDGGPTVSAEGGWVMADGFGFTMRYTANFERATAVFDLAGDPVLALTADGETAGVELAAGMGYDHEIAYLLDCIAHQRQPQRVTMRAAAESVRLIEAEKASLLAGGLVEV